jgi:hypothetical protein
MWLAPPSAPTQPPLFIVSPAGITYRRLEKTHLEYPNIQPSRAAGWLFFGLGEPNGDEYHVDPQRRVYYYQASLWRPQGQQPQGQLPELPELPDLDAVQFDQFIQDPEGDNFEELLGAE